MATKKKPAHEIRFGAVRAIIWSNVSSSGERWFTLAISRLYKDAQEKWQNANSYKLQHLLDLRKAIEATILWNDEHSLTPEGRALVQKLVDDARNVSNSNERRAS